MTPNKVDVAGINYDVILVNGLAEDHNLIGQVIYEKGIIKIDADICQDKKEQVFVHELLHAIFTEAGYDKQDEDMVNRLGIVLYQVLKSNKLYFGNAEIPYRPEGSA
ncbi:ImmA/IrrE family metallo-endopeptidase [Amphibacillus sp. MSJ-3]|uniref:ImmA/IrrE family metallo-endopeptidase n=1 Tax=Amphibacillus sp. MSJ-3 TaxID=2841505 RepID=UPI001C0E90B6|nr:ImmA/IrrE family metallo-endopeptidase [Amphibacillus sp. MSJ-3]MBU5594909.1 ImmA/IrrE family metallo-endopeptidase [Amphibacillus sp. MSJ-3]